MRKKEKKKLSDLEAKEILSRWPTYTEKLFGGTPEKPWIQAQPGNMTATTPCLQNAGANALATRPDGMWIRILQGLKAADVFCVEVCGNLQNFQDKRSRFLPTTNALVLDCRKKWLNEAIGENQPNVPRWKKCGVFSEKVDHDYHFPIRYLRVLFVITHDDFEKFWEHGIAAGHEFFLRHDSLSALTSQGMQDFLKNISPNRHFYLAK